MAANRIGIMDLRQLLLLKIKGVSNRKAHKLVGIHRNSVNQYVQQFVASGKSFEELLALSDEALKRLFPSKGTIDKARYEELSGQFTYFRGELKKAGCTKQILWQDYILKHPEGYGYTQFNEHLNRWLKRIKSSGKLTHKAGDKVYVDYTGKKLSYVDKETGEVIEVEVFVGILPCSQYTFVEASRSQKKEDFIASMNNCLAYFGGVPQSVVPDNLKSAVSKASKYEAVLNKTFKDFGLHYGCAINPTRSYSPQDKALVEGAVKIVYQRIFYPMNKMTFFSLDDINKEIQRLLALYNDYLLSNIDISRKQQFNSIEKNSLSSLPSEGYEIKTYKRATVQKMGYIRITADKNYYSVPYRHIGKRVEVRYDSQTVEVCFGTERLAIHKRNYQQGKYNTIKDHLSSHHKYYQGWSPGYFEKRAASYGEYVVAYIKALIAQGQYPEIAFKQCSGILSLYDKNNKDRLNKVCKRGLSFHKYGFGIIQNILKNNMDQLENDINETERKSIPEHKNVRGSEHYERLLNQLN